MVYVVRNYSRSRILAVFDNEAAANSMAANIDKAVVTPVELLHTDPTEKLIYLCLYQLIHKTYSYGFKVSKAKPAIIVKDDDKFSVSFWMYHANSETIDGPHGLSPDINIALPETAVNTYSEEYLKEIYQKMFEIANSIYGRQTKWHSKQAKRLRKEATSKIVEELKKIFDTTERK